MAHARHVDHGQLTSGRPDPVPGSTYGGPESGRQAVNSSTSELANESTEEMYSAKALI